jgi:hypothetical protein
MMGNFTRSASGRDELPTCRACGSYLNKGEGFQCPRCRRTPLCRNHRVPGRRECSGCVLEAKAKELRDLKNQGQSIRHFLRLTEFLFVVFLILFISSKAGFIEAVEFLKGNIIMENPGYLGGFSVAGYIIFQIIRYNQNSRVSELEAEINKMNKKELRRLVK